MQYQSTQSFSSPSGDNAMLYSQHTSSSFGSNQPTSNLTSSTNNTSSVVTYPSSTDLSHDQTTIRNKNLSHYNNQFGCRSVLESKRTTNQSDSDYFKLLYCMYSGCEGNAQLRIKKLVDSKHSSITIQSIKPIKKQCVGKRCVSRR